MTSTRLPTLVFCFLGYVCHLYKNGADAGYIAITTSLGYNYLLSDFRASSFSNAESRCISEADSVMSTFDNARLQDLIDFIYDNNPTYRSYEIWIPVGYSSSQYRFTGSGEAVGSSKWYRGEPNNSFCSRSSCCHRLKRDSTYHALADNPCSYNYNFICDGEPATTTTAEPTTTTAEPTTTTAEPTTTTAEPTTTTAEPTTTTAEPTTTTAEPTTTTDEPTTTTAEPTITTAEPTTTTAEPTTTNDVTTSTADDTTSTTADDTTSTTEEITSTNHAAVAVGITTGITTSGTIAVVTGSAALIGQGASDGTTTAVPLSTGAQMSIMYIGFIIGGSLGISCCCSLTWLGINRTRRSLKHEKLDNESSNTDSVFHNDDVSISCSSSSEEDDR